MAGFDRSAARGVRLMLTPKFSALAGLSLRPLWPALLISASALLLAACSSMPWQPAYQSHPGRRGSAHRTPANLPHFVDHSTGHEEIPIEAMSLVGVPYRWGGNTPDSGFDCSGLVQYVVARATSVKLPRTTADMSQRGEPVRPEEIAAGDLVFFNTTGRPHSHVGIYVGKLRFVDAPSTGGTVRLDSLDNPYWASHFDGIRRVVAGRASGGTTRAAAMMAQDHQDAPYENAARAATSSAGAADAADAAAAQDSNDDPIARFAHDGN
jgi:cell wall-associated NlpC family hydrolase